MTKINLSSTSLEDFDVLHDKAKELGNRLCLLDKEDSTLNLDSEAEFISSAENIYTDMKMLVAAIIAES